MAFSAKTIDPVQLAGPKNCEANARRFRVQLLHFSEIEKSEPLKARGGVWFAKGTSGFISE